VADLTLVLFSVLETGIRGMFELFSLLYEMLIPVCFVARWWTRRRALRYPPIPSTPSAKSSDVLRFALKTVNEQLDFLKSQWEGDKNRLLGERDVLREAAKRAEEDKARRARDEKKRVGVEAVG
jgi:hypothetical protein